MERQLLHRGAQSEREFPRLVRVHAGEDHDEFLASIAGDERTSFQFARQGLPHDPQHRIACAMAVGVVDALEMIDIEGAEAGDTALFADLTFHLGHAPLVGQAVRQAGQPVGQGQLVFAAQRVL